MAGSAAAPESYAYDEAGNRTVSHLSANHVVNAANRLTEDDQYCYAYDLNGNLESRTGKVAGACSGGVTTYSYDAQNQLIQIDFALGGSVAYAYDALGRRIRKEVDGTVTAYVYDGPDILLEFDGAGALAARYGHGNRVDQPLTMARDLDGSGSFGPGESFYYHAGHQGSVLFLTDTAGFVANEYTYDAYGRPLTLLESVDNPYLFTGREYDPESGLYHYRARAYDPETGRFLQEDPLGFGAGDLNLYRYVLNDPVNFTDPDGLWWRTLGRQAGKYATRGAIWLCKFSSSCTQKLFDAVKKGKELIDRAKRKIAQLCKRRADASLDNPSSLEGATPAEVEEVARKAGFTERGNPPRNDPNGVRLRKPGNPADQVRIQSGNPADPNPVKQGPYVRVSQDGIVSDPVPLAGNPTLR
jgi:RHS repeat-associated protein